MFVYVYVCVLGGGRLVFGVFFWGGGYASGCRKNCHDAH